MKNIKNIKKYTKYFLFLIQIFYLSINNSQISLQNNFNNINFNYFNSNNAYALSRIKDVVYFEGIRDNMLAGYGLVVGLNGTGDNLTNSSFTESSLRTYLNNLGINNDSSNNNLKTKNIAAVMVTATLPPFSRNGNKLNVSVSTLGDARSIKGGTLIATPLMGANGIVYALAQGQISISEMNDDNTRQRSKGILTNGFITNGAIVENEVDFNINDLEYINLSLRNPDITTANAIVNAINSYMRENIAYANDPGTIMVNIPNNYKNNIVNMLADIENIYISTNQVAKIVIDENSGTVVFSDNVNISKFAISQANMSIKVNPVNRFEDLILKNKKTAENSDPGKGLMAVNDTTTLSDLVDGLNSMGVKTQDLIAILRSIQQVGALQAIIEVR